ncbi:hypothetical protein MnTg02_03079 [bacterium MnTg02]|nr:hypothetical protein MnTg02_03079 [bacterium MnTg02]
MIDKLRASPHAIDLNESASKLFDLDQGRLYRFYNHETMYWGP